MTARPSRPGPLRWLGYAVGFGLPTRHREWVLHDVTAPTWLARHFARVAVQLLPVAALLFVLVPGPAWVRACAVLGGILIGTFYAAVYASMTADHRAVKAGYPMGTASAMRAERTAEVTAAQRLRYRRRYRADDPADDRPEGPA